MKSGLPSLCVSDGLRFAVGSWRVQYLRSNKVKRYTDTFRFQILSLFLLISIPAAGLSLAASHFNFEVASKQVLNAKQTSMNILVEQYDTSLEGVENYLKLLLYTDNSYAALRREITGTRYQQARVWLNDELSNLMSYFPLVSGFYVYVFNNDDIYMSKRKDQIPIDAQEYLQLRIPLDKPYIQPCMIECEEGKYLISGYRNSFLEIGFVIYLNELQAQLRTGLGQDDILTLSFLGSGEEIFLGEGEIPDKSGYAMLEKEFSVMPVNLRLYFPEDTMRNGISFRDKLLMSMTLLLAGFIPVFLIAIKRWFLIPMRKVSSAMQEILNGNIDYRIQKFSDTREFCDIEQAFNHMLDYSQNLKIEAYELKLEKEKEELINLKLQINPHLLLNSLSVVNSLAFNQKTEEIRDFTYNLSKYFRYALRNASEFVTVRSELEFVKTYSQVQRVRHPDAFYVMYDVDEELMEELIPPLIIQNFVENSTKYAIRPDKEIEIFVILRRDEEMLRLAICDDGRGMDTGLVQKVLAGEIVEDSRGQHVGIWNCQKRLRSFYGEKANFRITSRKGEGTQVWMEFPHIEA